MLPLPTTARQKTKVKEVRNAIDMQMRWELARAFQAQSFCMQTEDHKEAADAFRGKRTPEFVGR